MRSSKAKHHLTENDVTPESLYRSRRQFLKQTIYGGSAISLAAYAPQLAWSKAVENSTINKMIQAKLGAAKTTITTEEKLNSFDDITSYNNFYELGTDKSDPKKLASHLKTDPWSISIEGECLKPGKLTLEDILKPHDFEERIYRLRCVEAWSMVIPWNGFPLADLLKRFEPTSKAKYVAFETLFDKDARLPGQKRNTIRWPYREGLRIDEAMHPLTFMATGIYGKTLPNQNGAPIRLVVPWKYGFKSIKSIVKIKFTETQPETSWNMLAPDEYGFYSNVNPNVSHPRWSQKRERRIGELFKKETTLFNGYADEVAHLYKGMDLKKYY